MNFIPSKAPKLEPVKIVSVNSESVGHESKTSLFMDRVAVDSGSESDQSSPAKYHPAIDYTHVSERQSRHRSRYLPKKLRGSYSLKYTSSSGYATSHRRIFPQSSREDSGLDAYEHNVYEVHRSSINDDPSSQAYRTSEYRTSRSFYSVLNSDDGDGTFRTTPVRQQTRFSIPQRPSPERRITQPKKLPPGSKATDSDARKHKIPPGSDLHRWDPSEEPFIIFGSVFDANSLGRWIYEWTLYRNGPSTPIADMAGDLWLLLIQLAGKIGRSKECLPRIRKCDYKEMVEDFIESGERVFNKLRKVLKLCQSREKTPKPEGVKSHLEPGVGGTQETVQSELEAKREIVLQPQITSLSTTATPTLDPIKYNSDSTIDVTPCAKRESPLEGQEVPKERPCVSEIQSEQTRQQRMCASKDECNEFIDSLFGRDEQLEATEKFMSSLRLWNLRFDANCEDILQGTEQ